MCKMVLQTMSAVVMRSKPFDTHLVQSLEGYFRGLEGLALASSWYVEFDEILRFINSYVLALSRITSLSVRNPCLDFFCSVEAGRLYLGWLHTSHVSNWKSSIVLDRNLIAALMRNSILYSSRWAVAIIYYNWQWANYHKGWSFISSDRFANLIRSLRDASVLCLRLIEHFKSELTSWALTTSIKHESVFPILQMPY